MTHEDRDSGDTCYDVDCPDCMPWPGATASTRDAGRIEELESEVEELRAKNRELLDLIMLGAFDNLKKP